MSLINLHSTVRWATKNERMQPTLTEDGASELKKWLLEHGVRSVDIMIRINNKPAGSLEDGDKPSET